MVFNATKQYFSYIMVVSFIGGGNQSNWRKPLTNFITMFNRVHLAMSEIPTLNVSDYRH